MWLGWVVCVQVLTGVMVFVARDSSVQIAVGCLVNFAVLLANIALRPMADSVVRVTSEHTGCSLALCLSYAHTAWWCSSQGVWDVTGVSERPHQWTAVVETRTRASSATHGMLVMIPSLG